MFFFLKKFVFFSCKKVCVFFRKKFAFFLKKSVRFFHKKLNVFFLGNVYLCILWHFRGSVVLNTNARSLQTINVCVRYHQFRKIYIEPQIGTCSLNRRSPKMWTYISSKLAVQDIWPNSHTFQL